MSDVHTDTENVTMADNDQYHTDADDKDDRLIIAKEEDGMLKCAAPKCEYPEMPHKKIAAHQAQCPHYRAYLKIELAKEFAPAVEPAASVQEPSRNYHFSSSSDEEGPNSSQDDSSSSSCANNCPMSSESEQQDSEHLDMSLEDALDKFPYQEDKDCLLTHDFNNHNPTLSSAENPDPDSDKANSTPPPEDAHTVPPDDGAQPKSGTQPSSPANSNPIHHKLKEIQIKDKYSIVKPRVPIPRDIQFGIDLLSILPPKSPLYLYDKIINLVAKQNRDFFVEPPKRSDVEDALVERYHLEGLYPAVTPIPLTDDLASGPLVSVTTSSFVEGVNYLLHHIRDAPPESLLIDPDNPFTAPVERFTDSSLLGEFSSGTRFNHAYSACRRKHSNNRGIPLPINLEVDKTHIDATGKLTFEQVRQCIPWLTREETYFPAAWVGIGAVPNSVNIKKSHHNSKTAPGLSGNRDYHSVLNHILSEMKEVYRAGGLVCDLVLPKRDPITKKVTHKLHKEVTLYPYILYVNGDTEGHNKICSLKANSLHNCRICDVLKSESGRPDVPFNLRRMDEVKKLVSSALDKGDKEATKRLEAMSIYVTPNAFYEDIEFFQQLQDHAGVFGICPPELLHYLQKGKYCYVLEGFYEQPKTKKQKRKERAAKEKGQKRPAVKDQDAPVGKKQKVTNVSEGIASGTPPAASTQQQQVTEALSDNNADQAGDIGASSAPPEESNNDPTGTVNKEGIPPSSEEKQEKKTRRSFAIPKARHKLVNALAREVGIDLTHGSDPDIPRLLFPHGVTSPTHRSCSEMTGLMLFMLILLSTKCGQQIAEISDDRVRSGWIEMLERFLLYEAFLKCTTPKDRKTILAIRAYLVYLMFLYKHVVDRSSRTKGDGDNIIKFHLTLHIVDMILLYGLPANFTGGPHETRHIFFAKETGGTTQKRVATLDYQISLRQVLAIALNCYVQDGLRKASSEKTGKKSLYGKSYYFDTSSNSIHGRKGSSRKTKAAKARWVDRSLQRRIEGFMHDLCLEDFVERVPDVLDLHTELREERTTSSPTKLYRAHPNFSTDKTKQDGDWFDWCYVKWPMEDDDGNLVIADFMCHIRSFVHLPKGFLKPCYEYEGLEKYTIDHPEDSGDYAIIETISEETELMSTQHRKSWFFTKGIKYCTRETNHNEPDLFLVPVSHLHGTLSAFRDPLYIHKDTLEVDFRPNGYIFLKPIQQWSQQFVHLAKEFAQLPPDEQTRKTDLIRFSSIHEVLHDTDEEDEEDNQSSTHDAGEKVNDKVEHEVVVIDDSDDSDDSDDEEGYDSDHECQLAGVPLCHKVFYERNRAEDDD